LNVFGRGNLTFLYPSNRTVIAFLRQHEDVTVLCVTNLSRSAQAVELDLSGFVGRVPVELLGKTTFPVVGAAPYMITLQGHGFFWFQLAEPKNGAPAVVPSVPDLVTLVAAGKIASLTEDRNRRILETDVLPPFLRTRRWFAQKNEGRLQIALAASLCFKLAEREWCWAIVEARSSDAVQYSVPLADEWQAGTQPPPASILAVLRRRYHEGYLTDALSGEAFVRAAFDALLEGREIETSGGTLSFRPTPNAIAAPKPEKWVVRLGTHEQSNTSAVVEEFAILKFYRRIAAGIHPEIEMGGFLTKAGFANAPTLYGSLHLIDRKGKETALGIVHALVRNQGDGWAYSLAYLDRFLEESRVASDGEQAKAEDAHAAYLAQIERLAVRTAEFHRALYVEQGDRAFTVERVGAATVATWCKAVTALVTRALAGATRAKRALSADAAATLDDLTRRRKSISTYIRSLGEGESEVLLSRCHGDYHLGQVLIVQNDIFIVDLEGAPQISLQERRAKQCVVRDVACMLRSFDYAAWTALDRATVSQPDRRQELRQAIRLWRDQVGRAFLDSYGAAMEGCPLWPQDAAVARRLLSLFGIEKAALEILYELGNRPSWVGVPLDGLQSLLPPQS
jgi:maltose alpha-D-glucosyltransferase/alpha-amylase